MTEETWQRDARLRSEEARLVRFEEHLAAIDSRVQASHELLLEERVARRLAEDILEKHTQQDEQRFSSIDSRLQATQDQLSSIGKTLVSIDTRLQKIEKKETARSAVEAFLTSTWTHIGVGIGIAAGIAAVIDKL